MFRYLICHLQGADQRITVIQGIQLRCNIYFVSNCSTFVGLIMSYNRMHGIYNIKYLHGFRSSNFTQLCFTAGELNAAKQ
jgi:hypothetical protein